jgi:hypothetical protein
MLEGESFVEDSPFDVQIPRMIVLKTSLFDEFMQSNDLYDIALSDSSDQFIGMRFQKATLPFSILAQLRYLVREINTPLVVRSSSLLEDAKAEPFAGVYGTKMTPNNQVEEDVRFRKLVEAIKYVYSSTFFKTAKDYFKATRYDIREEKMGIIIQEVVGDRFGKRFYPEFSGVIKSYNYYCTPGTEPSDGVVNLAIGLGKEIVDGGVSWSFSPAAPLKSPPFKSTDALLKNTQLRFYSVNVGEPPPYDPVSEKEFLFYNHISTANADGTLQYLVSTYDLQSNRIWDGPKGKGPKIANFRPLLKQDDFKLNALIIGLMRLCERVYKTPVEIEFAVSLARQEGARHRFGFLQVRPMNVSSEVVEILDEDRTNGLLYSDMVMGNGTVEDLKDFLYVKTSEFSPDAALKLVREIDAFNEEMIGANRKYILFGFGRWGTTDPWAGIPVEWGQISGSRVIIESSREGLNQQMSQASHFFHNVSGFRVLYFSSTGKSGQEVLPLLHREQFEKVLETESLIHFRSQVPFVVKVDGRKGEGVIRFGDA